MVDQSFFQRYFKLNIEPLLQIAKTHVKELHSYLKRKQGAELLNDEQKLI